MLSVNFDHRGQTLSNESRQRWQFHAILPAHTVLFKIWKLNFKRKVRVLPYYQAKLHNYSSSYPVSYLTISKPQHAENERCQQRFDAAKLPFWSLAASITAKWRTWHCVTKRFLKRNSAFHLDHVGMFCCFFFFYALKPKLLRFTDTLVWALWHCVWEGATVQPMDSLDQSTLPLPEVIWGNIPCDLHPRHPKHPKTPNRCNIEKATKKPWWTGIGQCIQKTTC